MADCDLSDSIVLTGALDSLADYENVLECAGRYMMGMYTYTMRLILTALKSM